MGLTQVRGPIEIIWAVTVRRPYLKRQRERKKRSTDSNGPDNLYRSSDLGEPRLSGSLCRDEAQILLKSQTHTATITYQQ